MKRYKLLISGILISLASFVFFACEEEVLDKEPLNAISELDIWQSVDLAESYLNRAYQVVGHFGVTYGQPYHFKSVLTDDGTSRGSGPDFMKGIADASSGGYNDIWGRKYRYIREINTFLENIDEVPDATPEKIASLKAQARFLRAKAYADLVNRYSWWEGDNNGVPLVTKTYQLDDDFQVSRGSYDDVVSFIVSELDDIMDDLPLEWPDSEWGRITKGACMALKSEQLLYSASKLHNPDEIQSEWQAASDAAKAVIDLGQYELFPVETWEDYSSMFLEETRGNVETILARPYYGQDIGTRWIDKRWTPNGYTGWSNSNATQSIVDAFRMESGKKIDEEGSGYEPQDPYENRELRFYATIVYNGRFYRGREVEYFLPGEEGVTPGVDSPQGPTEPWNASPTRLNPYKYMDERITRAEIELTPPSTPYIVYRLAEFYLNYAEAQWHLGNEEEAREYINKLRRRAKIPEITSSGQELLDDIKHERRIELVFEGDHRFCDVRRWGILEEVSGDCIGIQPRKFKDGSITYETFVAQERAFDQSMYSFPIPLDEIQKTDLNQNPGY